MGMNDVEKLAEITNDIEIGSIVIPKDMASILRTAAAMAPSVSAVEFFVRLQTEFGVERAARVVAYLIAHPEIMIAREKQELPALKLQLIEEDENDEIFTS